MEYTKLNNGVEMPMLGYGVFQIGRGECERCVRDALDVGYRLIDTAQAYGNEGEVGTALLKSGIPREEIFLTTKIWLTNDTYKKTFLSFQESLKKLCTNYVDLLLIHQPAGDYYEIYRAMEDIYQAGKARAIGVSNFYQDRFTDFVRFCRIIPAVNQMETHVFQQERTLKDALKKYGTQLEAWAPLAEGRNDYFNHPVLKKIGEKHGKSTAQIALRFLLSEGVAAIPKTTHRERMEENFHIFDFALSEEERKEIERLDSGKSLFPSHMDYQTGTWLRAEPAG